MNHEIAQDSHCIITIVADQNPTPTTQPIRTPADIRNFSDHFEPYFKLDREVLLLLSFNNANALLRTDVVAVGGMNFCAVDRRILFRTALKNLASSIMIAHNHPSGNLQPSMEDQRIWSQVQECSRILDIQALDSIIFNHESYYSMTAQTVFTLPSEQEKIACNGS